MNRFDDWALWDGLHVHALRGEYLESARRPPAPNAGGIIPGRYYDNAAASVGNSNYNSAADRVDLAPFVTSRPLRVDEIGLAVATAGSAAYGRAFVYQAGADGWPADLLFEGVMIWP